jgi:hypothetical protein
MAKLEAFEKRIGQLSERVASLETELTIKDKALRDALAEKCGAVSAMAADLAEKHSASEADMRAVRQAQERQEKRQLANTLIVHAYHSPGEVAPCADSVRANVLRPTGLPPTEVLSCVQLGVGSATPRGSGDTGVSAAPAGAAAAAAGSDAPAAAVVSPPPGELRPGKRCVTFKVTLASAEAAKAAILLRKKHRELRTGLVVRQALTQRERILLRAYMPQFDTLRGEGRQGLDFRRGRLYALQGDKWVPLPLPASFKEVAT